MEKTPNYRLSQWAKTDRILMEDFNADNANLEAALSALAATQTSETTRINAALAQKADASALNSAKTTLETETQRLDSTKLEMAAFLDQSYTLSGSTSLTIPISGLGDYAAVLVDLDLPRTTEYCTVSVYPNKGDCYTTKGSSFSGGICRTSGDSSGATTTLLFFPMKRPDAKICVTSFGDWFCSGLSNLTYGEMTSLIIKFQSATTGTVRIRAVGIR